MGKRGNENAQQSKEDWESSQNDDSGAAPVDGFQVADHDQLKRRRIIKVDRKWRAPAGGAQLGVNGGPAAAAVAVAPPAPQPPRAAPSGSNPFANVSLTSGGATATTVAPAPAPRANPFANVSFAGSAAPAAPAPASASSSSMGNGFGGGGIFGAKPKLPLAAAPLGAVTRSSAAAGSSARRTKLRKDDELNIKFLKFVRSESKANPMSDWSVWMKEYVNFAGKVAKEMDGASSSAGMVVGSSNGLGAAPMGGITMSFPAPTLAPAPAAAPDQAQPFAGFAFAATAAAARASSASDPTNSSEAPKPFTSFSFGKPKAAPVPAPAPAAENDDDAAAKEDPTEVQKETNDDEDMLLEVKSKYYKLIDKKWKGFAGGGLRLYRHKSDPTKKRIVLRDGVGKVQLNLGISKGMSFNKQVKKSKGHIGFFAVQDQEKGPEQFNLVVKAEDVDKLYNTLKEMSS